MRAVRYVGKAWSQKRADPLSMRTQLYARNVRIWKCGQPHEVMENQIYYLKVNVFCAVSTVKVYGAYIVDENMIKGITYLSYKCCKTGF